MNDGDFRKLTRSLEQAGEIRRGERSADRLFHFEPIDIKAIRKKLDRSQTEFAAMIGVSVATLRNWEQGRRRPEGPARALLTVAAHNPEAVAKALQPEAAAES
ncbi:MAG: NadS family protein [Acidobacteriota bacterium]